MSKHARILLDMKLSENFHETTTFVNKKGMFIDKLVEYEWKPLNCSKCLMSDHLEDECKRAG